LPAWQHHALSLVRKTSLQQLLLFFYSQKKLSIVLKHKYARLVAHTTSQVRQMFSQHKKNNAPATLVFLKKQEKSKTQPLT
jgi:hypothetical protein